MVSWGKTSGGDVVTWVGFELRHRSYQLGFSERRAQWIINWTKKIAASTSVNVSTFEEGLGRVMYVAGALEYERPFLGPLCRFMPLHPRNSVRLVPAYVKFFLSHLATQLELCRHYSCAMEIHSWETAPRVDAQASEERTRIGGWLPVMNAEGKFEPWLSPWFSYELTRTDWTWIFERGDKPPLIMSTLEALAVLISLKLILWRRTQAGKDEGSRTKVQVVPTWTDNRENGSALNKLMSTKFPSSAVVMELSCYLKRMAAKAAVERAPRSTNYEADALANGITDSFDPSRRIVVDVNTPRWEILPKSSHYGQTDGEKIRKMQERAGYQPTEEGNSGDANRRTE